MSALESRQLARRYVLPGAFAVCTLGLVAWGTAVVLMAGRGLDTSDEGFYLLSYRWWDSTPRAFTGVQYIYGPILDVLGGSVGALRVFRFGSVIFVHATLGWSLVTWLRVRSERRLLTPPGEFLAVAAVTIAGAVDYGWLPLSPGYNDVAMLTSLALASALLRCMRAARLGRNLPVLPAVAAGASAAFLVVAKWSSAALVLAVVVVLGAMVLRRLRATGWLRFVLAGAGSFGLLAAGFVVLAGGRSTISTVVVVNRLAAESSNSPRALLSMYLRTGFEVLGESLLLAAPAVLCLAASCLLRSRGRTQASSALLALAPVSVALGAWPDRWGLPLGGSANIETYAASLIALTGLVIGPTWYARRADATGGLVHAPDGLLMLLLMILPLIQAVGTGNALYVLAVNGFGAWVAVLVVRVAESDGVVSELGRTALALALAVCLGVGISGLLEEPYRTGSFAASTVRIGGNGIVAGLRIPQSQARLIHDVQVAAHEPRRGAPVIAFDEMAGYVLALDGRSVGEAWYSAIDRHRTRVGIKDACARGDLGDERPVILFDRPPEEGDLVALRVCGIDLDTSYELVKVPYIAGRSILVYRPVGARE